MLAATITTISLRIMGVYHVPGVALNALYILTYLVLTTTLEGKCYAYSQFTDEETEAQGGQVSCPRSANI